MTAGPSASIQEPRLRKIAMKEVAQHNSHDDCWLVVHGKVYDVTQWAKAHPGGDIILLGGGRDCTIHYECYHPRGVAASLLDKYCVGELSEPTSDPYEWGSEFYPTLKKRVLEALAGRPRRGLPSMFLKSAIIMLCWVASWYAYAVQGSLVAAALFGFFSSQIGVSIMHDGSHGAYSKWPLLNKVAAFGMDLIGASTVTWEFQHVMGHHPYTNLGSDATHKAAENDPDVFSSYPFILMHPTDRKRRRWYMRFQHLYAPLLFALFTMGKVLAGDYKAWARGAVSQVSMRNRMSDPLCVARFVAMKTLSTGYLLLLPAYLHGLPWAVLMLATAHLVCGEFLALMFVVTHVSDTTTMLVGPSEHETPGAQTEAARALMNEYHVSKPRPVPTMDWAAMQCRTSINWATDSWIWTQLSGGLNHQVEHHLFPGICHMHYPTIRDAVRRTCAEFGVPYLEQPSLGAAVKHMLRYLQITASDEAARP
eukprot:CAMPEP_0196774276 /NCGR_PEP_ID=MMETSP1104-20130614/3292_1 /TAXON_ID=33652 /ORGANISM="Cafeteria sp., Strain Caron Lab Isolate" /LENGTH=478 /DNA_ID=CAMNT_0042144429 /DNA_START=100 /DNA_END=1536 /DNA_ORIENTATION=-